MTDRSPLTIRASLLSAKSASATLMSASAFLVLTALLSLVPERPVAQQTVWQLRGALAHLDASQAPCGPLDAQASAEPGSRFRDCQG